MRLRILWNFFLVIIAAISLSEAAVIRHVQGLGGNALDSENDIVQPGFPPPRKTERRNPRLKWHLEDADRSNERNLWISHPKPKTQYDGPDTQESEGPG